MTERTSPQLISIVPESIDFGNVVGESSLNLLVLNSGSKAMQVAIISDKPWIEVKSNSFSVAGQQIVNVTASARKAGVLFIHRGRLIVTYDSSTVSVPVRMRPWGSNKGAVVGLGFLLYCFFPVLLPILALDWVVDRFLPADDKTKRTMVVLLALPTVLVVWSIVAGIVYILANSM